MRSRIILSRVPFRLPLGGGSTDLPSYYEKYGGFIFATTINLYMDVFIKEPVVDDYIHMQYMKYEFESSLENIKHTIGKEAIRMNGITNKILVSFTADTPSGTGLGSSGACSVALLKGLSLFKGKPMDNRTAAEQSFLLTRRLGLPDGPQDPYVCALGGFVVLEIQKNGTIITRQPRISPETARMFVRNTLLFYTGIRRDSKPLLSTQSTRQALALKHQIKEIGKKIHESFCTGNLDKFGRLLDEHWRLKKGISSAMSSDWLNEIYATAKKAGALGGKIMGAGGGGYFMFYCPTPAIRSAIRDALRKLNLREVLYAIDAKGARTKVLNI